MNELSGDHLLDYNSIRQLIEERDRELDNKFSKDTQINYIRSTRKYLETSSGVSQNLIKSWLRKMDHSLLYVLIF